MIRRIVGWVVLVPLCIVLIVFALANRQLVVINVNPLVPPEALSSPGVGVPIGGRLGHRRFENGDEFGWHVRSQQLDRRVLARLHPAKGLERGGRTERIHSRDALVEDRAEREEIAPGVNGLARRLFRTHVSELAL